MHRKKWKKGKMFSDLGLASWKGGVRTIIGHIPQSRLEWERDRCRIRGVSYFGCMKFATNAQFGNHYVIMKKKLLANITRSYVLRFSRFQFSSTKRKIWKIKTYLTWKIQLPRAFTTTTCSHLFCPYRNHDTERFQYNKRTIRGVSSSILLGKTLLGDKHGALTVPKRHFEHQKMTIYYF